MTVRTPPFNLKKHRVLLATGYKYKHHEASFYNNYNIKNDIEVTIKAYDKYSSEKEYIYINASGEIIRREFRDLEDRRWYWDFRVFESGILSECLFHPQLMKLGGSTWKHLHSGNQSEVVL